MYLYIIDLFLAILGHTLHIFHLFVCFEQKKNVRKRKRYENEEKNTYQYLHKLGVDGETVQPSDG